MTILSDPHSGTPLLPSTFVHTPHTFLVQVVGIPNDPYLLALQALDRSFNPVPLHAAATSLDFNLQTSPYVLSRAKHHAIYHTAHKIMRRLDDVAHEASMG